MTSITAPAATDLDAALARVGEVMAEWKPFCSPAGCVCEKYADCYYCEACIGMTADQQREYEEWLAAEIERERVESLPLGLIMYGEPTEDDYHEEW